MDNLEKLQTIAKLTAEISNIEYKDFLICLHIGDGQELHKFSAWKTGNFLSEIRTMQFKLSNNNTVSIFRNGDYKQTEVLAIKNYIEQWLKRSD